MNDRDAEVKVTMQGLEIVKVVMFKYLESPTQSNIQRGAEEVKKRVQVLEVTEGQQQV